MIPLVGQPNRNFRHHPMFGRGKIWWDHHIAFVLGQIQLTNDPVVFHNGEEEDHEVQFFPRTLNAHRFDPAIRRFTSAVPTRNQMSYTIYRAYQHVKTTYED